MKAAKEEVLKLERGFWEQGNDAEFYKANLTEDGLNVIEPMGFVDKASAVKMTAKAKPWKKVKMEDVHVQELTDDCMAVSYHGQGEQEGMDGPYRATVSSVYVRRDGGWKLALTSHQPWKEKE